MNETLPGFECHDIGDGYNFWVGQLPGALLPNAAEFESLWRMHPTDYHEIKMHGRLVKTPRWQQAFGVDYHYTGRVNSALPVPSILAPYLEWARTSIARSLNGLLLNWYDGALGHYIGRHRDSIKNMCPGAPIVTISTGEKRVFRLRRWRSETDDQPRDFSASNGSVFIMPWETNRAFTHEVPHSKRHAGRRVSITLRSFETNLR
ncbi:MAG: 2OG-Fe(II) oxygenase [Verrucomicrobia bacterium]|nr:MAG: 2OG-Fe(II) oxygenase [Verrucomicrobiota bacterium]